LAEPSEQLAFEYPTTYDVLTALAALLPSEERTPERVDIKQVGGPHYVAKVYYPGDAFWEPYDFSI